MADRIVTSTPRHAGTIVEDEEESIDFAGFEQLAGKYRDIEDEMSSIDNSFYERETILQEQRKEIKGEEK